MRPFTILARKVFGRTSKRPDDERFLDILNDGALRKAAGCGKKITVAVEGNVGSGKTSFLEYCQRFPGSTTFIEPVNTWRDIGGENLLGLMYHQPTRWGLTFQTYVQLTMLKLHLTPVSTPVKLMERSIHSARYVFVENLRRRGFLQQVEYNILDEWYQWLRDNENVDLDLIVYLRTDPEVALERIRKRKRPEEVDVPLDYLTVLHELHDNWLLGKSEFPLPAKVLVIDANRNLHDLRKEFDRHIPDLIFSGTVTVSNLVPPLHSSA